tara:strand:- start:8073 stop:9797 length:1725 start_codon:yes stop_codon:yes gene_type:complete
MGAVQNVVGMIRGFKDRERAKQLREAQADLLNDPQAALERVAAIDAPYAYQLKRKLADDAWADRNRNREVETQGADDYAIGVRGVLGGLKGVRDQGGDLLAEYDRITPILRNGFMMDDAEIGTMREQLGQNPGMLEQLESMYLNPKDEKPQILSSGAALVDNQGNVLYQNPHKATVAQVPRGDGGRDVLVFDQNGNPINTSMVPGAPPPADVPGNGSGTSRGERNNNSGNLKASPWTQKQPGYVGQDAGGFAIFESAEAGQRAQETLLNNYYVDGNRTVDGIVNKYLGGSQNPENSALSQKNYKAYVAQRLGIGENEAVPRSMTAQLAQAMREFETGNTQGGGSGGGMRPVYSTAGKPSQEGWRALTEQEAQARNLDPSRAWQIGLDGANKGKVVPVGNQAPYPKAGANKDLKPEARESAESALRDLIDAGREIVNHPAYNQATGSVQGRLPSILPSSREFDSLLESYTGRVVVDALMQMKQNSPNGATGFGAMNQTEGTWLKSSQGAIDPTAPDSTRNTINKQIVDAQISRGMLYNVPARATAYLLQNPETAAQYDEKFKQPGLAKRILENRR